MKRISLIFAIIALTALTLFAEHVNPETARKVATTFLNNNGAKTTQLTDLSKAAGFPNLYIFNSEEGFVILSADNCVKPILGYSLTGKFVTENMPENVSSWLQGYNDEIQYAIESGIKSAPNVEQEWNDLIHEKAGVAKTTPIVNALVTSTWGQDTPFNNLCPYDSDDNKRTVTGCVATAMAQIMYYWKYPSQGSGYHSYTPSNHPKHGVQSVDFGATTYDWSNMLNSYSGSYSELQANAVATLMYHCGVSVDMDYDYALQNTAHTGSSASTYNVMFALENYFNYAPSMHYESKSSYSDETWITMLKQELDNGRPLQYRGSKTTGGGHSFVCDGYDDNNYFHFNWGWNSSNNGFYSVKTLCSAAPFTKDQEAIFGIQSIVGNLQPTNLAATVSGRNVNLTWDGVEGASSYKVYCDYNLIGDTTACSFNDTTACIGSHTYFVRGVKNNNVTLQSNIATATVTFGGTVEELKIDHLQASYANGSATLDWTTPYRLYYINYHSLDDWYYWGSLSEDTYYWGVRFPASILSSGVTLTSVSNVFSTDGQYTTYIYQCTSAFPSGDPITTITDNYPSGWNNIVFPDPITIDHEKDLWVICKSTGISYPLTFAEHYSDDGCFYSNNGSNWYRLQGYSFLVSANLSDGTFTYNIFDGNTKTLSGLTAPNHTLDVGTNNAHQYTVKAQKGEAEAKASNMIGFTRGSATLSSLELDNDDAMTITSGSTLTVTGTLTNTNADNLILEDGAQLIHHSDGVKATVKRSITTYTSDSDGWYTIAAPFTEFSPTQVATGSYDLYAYDEDGEKEWINYKAHLTDFPITQTNGYLYAHSPSTTINMTGTLNNGDFTETVNLSYGNSQESIKGYNLLGNPTTHDITFTTSANVSDGYYYLENGDQWVYSASNTVPSGRGFLVKAEAPEQSVTLNQTSREKTTDSFLCIKIDNQKTYVKMGEGVSMPLLDFKGKRSNTYLIRNGQPYIMLVKDNQNEIPVCFKAPKDGESTLTVSTTPTSHLPTPTYLHRVDNLTGADIDLLQTPNYSFNALADDYESRFKLVFSESEVNDPGEDEFDITDDSLEILDVTGRVVATDLNTKLTPGVYILKNANNNKTKKIIIN
ncbi:MAG: C10 family peptidase [Bacteroidales bacterium]|nr:C10 family peptidase [Bacteroidales bacterium]